jgi:peroxiredoxin
MRILTLILFLISMSGYGQEQALNIEVTLKGMPDSSFFYLNKDRINIDSCFSNGEKLRFTYQKNTEEPNGLLVLSKDRKQGYIIWIENTSLKLNGKYKDLNPLIADKSATQDIFREYMLLTTALKDSLSANTLNFQRLQFSHQPDSTIYKIKIDSVQSALKKINIEFIKHHPNSVISTQTLFYEASHRRFTNEEVISSFLGLSHEQQNSPIGQGILKSVSLYQNPKPGEKAPDFSVTDESGKTVKLSDFKGRTVVLLFWASWCGPCLKELPDLLQFYNGQRKSEVVFIAISLDNDKESWASAVKKYKLPFTNVFDGKGWMSEPALIYGVSGIPDHFLIDANGVLVEREQGISGIRRKLAENGK